MSEYVSLKGWLECSEDEIQQIKNEINHFWETGPCKIHDKNILSLYKSGWVFPDSSFNWSSYVFLGVCIRSYYVDFFKNCIKHIAELNIEVSGYFEADYYDECRKSVWKIEDNVFLICN